MIANHLFDFRYDCINWNSPKPNVKICKSRRTRRSRRKKEYLNHPNEKFLGVQNPFFKKGFGRRRQKLAVDLGSAYLTLIDDWDNNKVSLFWELFFSDRLIKGYI